MLKTPKELKLYFYSVTTTWELWAESLESAMEKIDDASFLDACPYEITEQKLEECSEQEQETSQEATQETSQETSNVNESRKDN